MMIQWLGHSCFRISLPAGSLLTDPYDPSVGYDMPVHGANIVCISHDHYDHNFVGALKPELIARRAGVYERDGVRIEGFDSFHDDSGGKKRGKNVIFSIESEGRRVVHLGDLGHMPSRELIERIARPDVLLIPVGGVYTIDAAQAAELAREIDARVTVPMHYRTEKLSFELGKPDLFFQAMGGKCDTLDGLNPDEVNAPVVALRPGFGL